MPQSSSTEPSQTVAADPRPVKVIPPPEPFGQVGVRRFILPALTVLSFLVTCAAGLMSYRSMEVADSVARSDEDSTLIIRSVYGRILVTYFRPGETTIPRIDNGGRAAGRPGANWSYGVSELPEFVRDGWRDSWRKSIGIEWRREPLLLEPDPTATGWWLRIRWRLVMILSLVIPLVRAIAHQRRVWKARV